MNLHQLRRVLHVSVLIHHDCIQFVPDVKDLLSVR